MLHKITIENFSSIADKQELTFEVPVNAPDLACFKPSRSNQDIRLPAVIGFFGANASGKSTVLRAITNAASFACNSYDLEYIATLFQPYRQESWWEKPTKISIDFDGQLSNEDPSVIFRYELHIAHQANNKFVAYEALFYAPKGTLRRLFERTKQVFYFGKEFNISNTNDDPRKEMIRPNASVISTLAKSNHPIAIYLRQFISGLPKNILGINKLSHQESTNWLSVYKNQSYLDNLNRELRRFDIGLESMSVEQIDKEWVAQFKHVGLDAPVFFMEESTGTQRFIKMFILLHSALETGQIAIIDEIDTDLHPVLLPELLRWFSDPKRNLHGAQLLFTAHNPALLDHLEKEQIFFTEKLLGKASQVYSVCDIKGLRREPSLMKKYLAGELGAVPHVG